MLSQNYYHLYQTTVLRILRGVITGVKSYVGIVHRVCLFSDSGQTHVSARFPLGGGQTAYGGGEFSSGNQAHEGRYICHTVQLLLPLHTVVYHSY